VRLARAALVHNRCEPFSTSSKETIMADNPQNPSSHPGGDPKAAQGGFEPRSEGLLPADGADDGQDDGRFEVAEEVSLDQQSDKMRHVGQAADVNPVDNDPDAAADDTLPDPGKQSDG
jgi:hypothetical protein